MLQEKGFSCWVIEGLNGFEVDGQSKNDAVLQQSCQLSELVCHVSVQMADVCVCVCELWEDFEDKTNSNSSNSYLIQSGAENPLLLLQSQSLLAYTAQPVLSYFISSAFLPHLITLPLSCCHFTLFLHQTQVSPRFQKLASGYKHCATYLILKKT